MTKNTQKKENILTNGEKILSILSDCEWHCAVCDFGNLSSQHATIIRDLAKVGYKFDIQSNEAIKIYKYGISKFCTTCNRNTTHRKLLLDHNK